LSQLRVLPSNLKDWIWATAIAGVVLIPVIFDIASRDAFRFPREVAFMVLSITLVTLLLVAGIWGRIGRSDLPRFLPLLLAIPLWACLSAANADVFALTVQPLMWCIGAVAFLGSVETLSRGRPLGALGWLFVPVVPNVVIYLLQETHIWNPFITLAEFEKFLAASGRPVAGARHGLSIGLLGNPTDVGGFLIAPTLVLLALALMRRGPVRAWFAVAAAALFATIVSTQILTAAAAAAAGILVLVVVKVRRRFLVGLVLLGVMILGVATMSPDTRHKIALTMDQIASLRFEQLASGRMSAFVPAWQMAMDHKLTGVGPGGFAHHFFDYSLSAQESYPWLLDSPNRGVNFGEVHNDHLQILAEEGIPGYLLFLAALIALATGSFVRRLPESEPADARHELSRLISLPLAVSIAVYSLAQFPLEIPAVSIGLLYVGALAIGWRRPLETS